MIFLVIKVLEYFLVDIHIFYILRNMRSAEENFFHLNISKEKLEVSTSKSSSDFSSTTAYVIWNLRKHTKNSKPMCWFLLLILEFLVNWNPRRAINYAEELDA